MACAGVRRLHLVTAVAQFRQLSEIELDLRLEAAAAAASLITCGMTQAFISVG